MTPEDAFLDDIREHPDEDAPRLIFADWLEDNGDADRGEFIRAQVRLYRGGDRDSTEARELSRRCEQLLEANWERWVGPLKRLQPEGSSTITWAAVGYRPEAIDRFRRGFIEEVEVRADRLVEVAAELFQLFPIRHLRLRGAGDAPPGLAECEQLARIETLVFDDYFRAPLNAEGMAWLAGNFHIARLWLLDLSRNYLGDVGAAHLADAPWLPRLRWVVLTDNGLSQHGVEALTGRHYSFRPRRLTLNHNPIGDPGGVALAESHILGRVETLGLRDCRLGDATAFALARSPHLESLVELDLTGNDLSAEGRRTIADAPWRSRLRSLGT